MRARSRGHFAEVRECTHKETGVKYAVKMLIKKDLHAEATVRREVQRRRAAAVRRHTRAHQIECLRTIGHHPYIVSLREHFEDRKCFYLVMDLCVRAAPACAGRVSSRAVARVCSCSGGDLFHRISAAVSALQAAAAARKPHALSQGKCSERNAAEYSRQIAEALRHIHAKGITHRDLKVWVLANDAHRMRAQRDGRTDTCGHMH